MDKILSARVDEFVLHRIKMLAHRLHTSQKKIIETAINVYAKKVEAEKNIDVLQQTCGAWKRRGSVEELIKRTKSVFRESLTRHQK